MGPQLREELALTPDEDALMRIDPGFPRTIRVSRLDAFLHDYDVKFLEFNTDSPAGMAWTDMLYEALRDKVDLPRVTEVFTTGYTPVLPEVVDDAARRVPRLPASRCRTCPSRRGSRCSTWPAHRRWRSFGSFAGSPSRPASRRWSPRSTRSPTTARTWSCRAEPAHLVYRRALVEDMTEESPLAIAAHERRAVVVNPFRVHVAANKKILALLQDERFEHLVTRAELETISKTVPLDPNPPARADHLRRLALRTPELRHR